MKIKDLKKGLIYGLPVETNLEFPFNFPFPLNTHSSKIKIFRKDEDGEKLNINSFKPYSSNRHNSINCFESKTGKMYITDLIGKVTVLKEQINYYPSSDVVDIDKSSFLLCYGIGMSTLARMNDRIVLHSSVLVNDVDCFIIMGTSGSGKSTLCASIAANTSIRMISDDLAVIDKHKPVAYVGFPFVRLWPESIKAIFGETNYDNLPLYDVGIMNNKKYVDLRKLKNISLSTGCYLIKKIFFIEDIDSTMTCLVDCRKISKAEAFQRCIKNIYARYTLTTDELSKEIVAIHDLIKFCECYVLRYNKNYDKLDLITIEISNLMNNIR